MLSHVASLLPYVFYGDTSLNVFDNFDLLYKCYISDNLLGFIHVYKQICDRNININWNIYNNYLTQAITVYPPPVSIANDIISGIISMCRRWNSQHEQPLKLLAKYADDKNKHIMIMSGYYHLVPNSTTTYNIMYLLSNALRDNNIEEVRHISAINQNLFGMPLYDAIISPLNNKESLSLIIPYLHTSDERVNSIIVLAYVNNELPSIPADLINSPPIKILTAHFNNTTLGDCIITKETFYLADKFGFSNALFFKCVELGSAVEDISQNVTQNSSHKIIMCLLMIKSRYLMKECGCSMCEYLRSI